MAKRKRNASVEAADESGDQHQKKLKAASDGNSQSQNSAQSSGPPDTPSQSQKRKQRRLRKLAKREALAAAQALETKVPEDPSKTRLPEPPQKQWVTEIQKPSNANGSQSPQVASAKATSGNVSSAENSIVKDDKNAQTPQKKKRRKPRKPRTQASQPVSDSQVATDTAPVVIPTAPKSKAKVARKAGNISDVNFGKHPEQALKKLSEFLGDDDSSDQSSDEEPSKETQKSQPSPPQKSNTGSKRGTKKIAGSKASKAQDGVSEDETSALREIRATRERSSPDVQRKKSTPKSASQGRRLVDKTEPAFKADRNGDAPSPEVGSARKVAAKVDELEAEAETEAESEIDESEANQQSGSGWSIFKPSTWFSRSKPENKPDSEMQVLTEQTSHIRSLRSRSSIAQPSDDRALQRAPLSAATSQAQDEQTSSPKQLRSGRVVGHTTPESSIRRSKRTVIIDIDKQSEPFGPKPSSTRSLRSWRSFDHSPVKEPINPKPTKRTPTRRTSTKSDYFLPLERVDLLTPSRRRAPAGVSIAPVPPISNEHFGIIQEKLWREPFWMLVAVILLNKTTGRAAIPTFWKIREKYPDPSSLAAADQAELAEMIYYCGLFNQRSKSLIKLASVWDETPPQKGIRWRTLHYPAKGDGKEFSGKEGIEGDVRECAGALEIGHLPGCGRYAYDSWRIFCRDVLRHVAGDYRGGGVEGEGFEPEWKRVLPEDKELRATVRWMWLREGWIWNHEDGEKRRATDEEMQRAVLGEMDVPDKDELRFAAIAVRKELPIE